MAHQLVEMYGRGVSAEAESPPTTKRRIGGPQPRLEHSPILFDKVSNGFLHTFDVFVLFKGKGLHNAISGRCGR